MIALSGEARQPACALAQEPRADAEAFPFRRASDLEGRPAERRWLVEDLWAAEAVGIVGGEPKCCKSFLALDLAVAVASGMPCLRRFATVEPGPVLLFAAEDALHVVRRRIEGIAAAAGVEFRDLNIFVITAPTIRLDLEADRRKLADTVSTIRPRLLVLDPFVRLHRIDENVAAEVAPLLAHLRDLERRFQVAVVLVHHSRKGAGHERAGQALRGSSELHAWGDSNLYLRKAGDQILLTTEHRAAPSSGPIALDLHESGAALALRVINRVQAAEKELAGAPADRIIAALAASKEPLTARTLRHLCRLRMARLYEELERLIAVGRVARAGTGYCALVGERSK